MSMPPLLPNLFELIPWTDRRGRFNTMRATVLGFLVAPGLYVGARWALGLLGPEPVNAAIHATGYYAVWILLASLVVSPWKALAAAPNVVVIRRMIGNAALLYAMLHLGLYAMDQHWRLFTIVSEIVKRFYLTIGFVALLGLFVLGATSTDAWVRHLGKRWKQLHRGVYALAVLGLFHYALQSKLDVSQALLAVGVFAWLMLWRALPAGRDRAWYWLLAITLAAAAVTLACEYLWYRFGTRINPEKVVLGELDISYGLHPAVQVLVLGVLATGLVELRRLADSAPEAAPPITMATYALAGVIGEAMPWFFGWQVGDVSVDEPYPWVRAGIWVALLAILGLMRCRLSATPQRPWIDTLLAACIVYDIAWLTTDDPRVVTYGAGLLVAGAVILGAFAWSARRGGAVMLVPLVALLVYQAALTLN